MVSLSNHERSLSPLPSWERVGERGMVAFRTRVAGATSALMPRVAVTFFCFAKRKSPKKRRPQRFACFLRCSQRAGPAQIARWRASLRAVGSWSGSTTARCSAPRGESMGTRRTDSGSLRDGVHEPGCEHPGYANGDACKQSLQASCRAAEQMETRYSQGALDFAGFRRRTR